jgi:hypothetical protein
MDTVTARASPFPPAAATCSSEMRRPTPGVCCPRTAMPMPAFASCTRRPVPSNACPSLRWATSATAMTCAAAPSTAASTTAAFAPASSVSAREQPAPITRAASSTSPASITSATRPRRSWAKRLPVLRRRGVLPSAAFERHACSRHLSAALGLGRSVRRLRLVPAQPAVLERVPDRDLRASGWRG